MIVSVSGPSKSGKTVMIKQVISEENLITISGASIQTPDDLWDGVLAWMGVPESESSTSTSTNSIEVSGSAKGEAGILFVAKGAVDAGMKGGHSRGTATTAVERKAGLPQVVKEIGGSDFVVFIDDFHYIPKAIQSDIGKQIKAAAESGVKVVTASVPHRSDDVVRSNPELRGRVCAVDLDYWSDEDLRRISLKGFEALNVDIAPDVEKRLVAEAFGSPQLMQTICLNLCFECGAKETKSEQERIEVPEGLMRGILERASVFADYSTLIDTLHSGPKQRGTERKFFDLSDGSKGDVYRPVLLALRQNPPHLSVRYDEMLGRTRGVCINDAPSGSSVSEALAQMDKLAAQISPTARIIEWDEDVLDVVEPYFLFFLRCSTRLDILATARQS